MLATIEAVKYCSNLSSKSNDLGKNVRQMRSHLEALIDCLPRISAFMTQRTVPVKLIKQLAYEIISLVSEVFFLLKKYAGFQIKVISYFFKQLGNVEEHMEIKQDRMTHINERLLGLQEILDKISLRRGNYIIFCLKF